LEKINKEIHDEGKDTRETAKSIIDDHAITKKFNHDRETNPSITIDSKKICEAIKRYNDRIAKWRINKPRLKFVAESEATSRREKRISKEAKNRLKYIENYIVPMKAGVRFGKC